MVTKGPNIDTLAIMHHGQKRVIVAKDSKPSYEVQKLFKQDHIHYQVADQTKDLGVSLSFSLKPSIKKLLKCQETFTKNQSLGQNIKGS